MAFYNKPYAVTYGEGKNKEEDTSNFFKGLVGLLSKNYTSPFERFFESDPGRMAINYEGEEDTHNILKALGGLVSSTYTSPFERYFEKQGISQQGNLFGMPIQGVKATGKLIGDIGGGSVRALANAAFPKSTPDMPGVEGKPWWAKGVPGFFAAPFTEKSEPFYEKFWKSTMTKPLAEEGIFSKVKPWHLLAGGAGLGLMSGAAKADLLKAALLGGASAYGVNKLSKLADKKQKEFDEEVKDIDWQEITPKEKIEKKKELEELAEEKKEEIEEFAGDLVKDEENLPEAPDIEEPEEAVAALTPAKPKPSITDVLHNIIGKRIPTASQTTDFLQQAVGRHIPTLSEVGGALGIGGKPAGERPSIMALTSGLAMPEGYGAGGGAVAPAMAGKGGAGLDLKNILSKAGGTAFDIAQLWASAIPQHKSWQQRPMTTRRDISTQRRNAAMQQLEYLQTNLGLTPAQIDANPYLRKLKTEAFGMPAGAEFAGGTIGETMMGDMPEQLFGASGYTAPQLQKFAPGTLTDILTGRTASKFAAIKQRELAKQSDIDTKAKEIDLKKDKVDWGYVKTMIDAQNETIYGTPSYNAYSNSIMKALDVDMPADLTPEEAIPWYQKFMEKVQGIMPKAGKPAPAPAAKTVTSTGNAMTKQEIKELLASKGYDSSDASVTKFIKNNKIKTK